ncbi:MAG: cyclic nucleotide-binding domain-containing protein [Pseudomonadota bacterium]
MGIDEFMVRRALRSWLNPATHGRLIEEIIRLRPEIRQRLADAGVSDIVHEFHPDKFNPVTPLGSNLLYALPDHPLTQRELAEDKNFVRMLREEGVTDELAKLAAQLLEGLMTTFGKDGTDHPMFQRLNMDLELYSELGAIVMDYKQGGEASLSVEQYALMLTVPFAFSADQIGPAVDEAFIERLLDIRKRNAAHMVAALNGQFETFNPERYLPVMTLLGNAIFGTVSQMAGAREKIVEDTVVAVLNENGLRRLAAQSIFDVETATGGDNLPAVFRERVAFSRAGIKKPDVLILGNALASHDATARAEMRSRISDLMPEATKIFIEKQINNPENYDVYVEIVDGRIDGLVQAEAPASQSAQADLNRKLKVIAQTDLFQGLERKHQRLLAFSARWYKAESGQVIFATDEEPDAAYLCVDGRAGMYWPVEDGDEDYLVTEVTSGRLVGDLSVILGKRRTLYLKAMEDCVFLRLSAQDLLSVIESDVRVATSLLRSVGDHLIGAGDTIRSMQDYAIARGVDFSEYDP